MLKYLRSRVGSVILLAVCCGIFALVFAGYAIDAAPVLYAGAVSLVIVLGYAALDCVRFGAKLSGLKALKAALDIDGLPEPSDEAERLYTEMLRALFEEKERLESESARKLSELSDYYTLWTHQIKVPIAAARLILQSGEADAAELSEQLRRIEDYTEMVMCYARLQSDSTDYVIKEYSLDEIVHKAVKEHSSQFIRKKLSLEVKKSGKTVITDEKQLGFVIGQVVSNAVKYTDKGGVEIYCENDCLCVRDTGIGVAAEDLPRIFEKGYTGLNGRLNEKSSGIGLYLCKRICEKLGHRITAESGKNGTLISISLSRGDISFE